MLNDIQPHSDPPVSSSELVSLCVKWEDMARQHANFAKEYELKGEPSFLSEAHWHKSNTLKLCAEQLRDAAQANTQALPRGGAQRTSNESQS